MQWIQPTEAAAPVCQDQYDTWKRDDIWRKDEHSKFNVEEMNKKVACREKSFPFQNREVVPKKTWSEKTGNILNILKGARSLSVLFDGAVPSSIWEGPGVLQNCIPADVGGPVPIREVDGQPL